jgi:hypothetical protein
MMKVKNIQFETIEDAIALTRFALSLDRRNPKMNYYLAYFYAVGGKPRRSIYYIEQALKNGFHSFKLITHDRRFSEVRQFKAFWTLINKYHGASKIKKF